jgi:cupin fold WbuC family metalloprotein
MKLINRELIGSVLEQARQSPRRRMNFNFHSSPEDNPQRFLNVMLKGSYFTPHRHREPPKAESFVVLEGELALVQFEEDGAIRSAHRLGPGAGAHGIDVEPGVWHSLVVLSDYAVVYEVKPGPYSAAADKEMAPWAPQEGDPAAKEYLTLMTRSIPERIEC